MIFIEKSAERLPLVKLLDTSSLKVIDDGEQVEDKKTNIVITSKRDNFVHPCPATNIYRCCNYHVADIMQGCPFDCSYCILQAYLPHKHIRVTADTDAVIMAAQDAIKSQKRRIGTGELADSLALDNVIPLSKILVPFANANDNIQFEFKTKSANVGNLLTMNPKNVVVSWSLNPRSVIRTEEPLTAPLEKRLAAAADCAKHGYKLGFHFDPLIDIPQFHEKYTELIEELTSAVPQESVEFISVSTFRCPEELMQVIRLRKQTSILTKGDYIRGIDGKVRYFKASRVAMMKFVIEKLRQKWQKPFIYLCMEHESVWQTLLGTDPQEREMFEKLFPFYNCSK